MAVIICNQNLAQCNSDITVRYAISLAQGQVSAGHMAIKLGWGVELVTLRTWLLIIFTPFLSFSQYTPMAKFNQVWEVYCNKSRDCKANFTALHLHTDSQKLLPSESGQIGSGPFPRPVWLVTTLCLLRATLEFSIIEINYTTQSISEPSRKTCCHQISQIQFYTDVPRCAHMHARVMV